MNTRVLYYATAAATAVAGILHLVLAPNMLNFNPNGAAQVFWALPMARRWGKAWYGVGIGGTAALMSIWIITRMPGNPITDRGGGVSEMAMAVEAMQGNVHRSCRSDNRDSVADETAGQKDHCRLGLSPLF